jgi:hypothetical protein
MVFRLICKVKNIVFLVVFLLIFPGFKAQENPNSPQVQTSLKVKLLVDKKSAYNRLNNGEYDGFRIKIHFGVDKVKAREIKSRFQVKFNDYLAYEDYQQPNFVIVVGDFRTKLEAIEALKKIQAEFPNSFIVKSKIKPMRL